LNREFQDRLGRRVRRAGISLDTQLTSKLATYFELLAIWNGKINLTGFDLSDPTSEAIDKLFVEPLIAARYIRPTVTRMIDIGSGGGSPAIPMLLAHPRLQILLVEAKIRKSVFLKEALRGLGVASGEVATARFEELLSRPDLHEAHDLLTIRAVRIEPRVLMSLQAFVKPSGELFLFRSGSTATAPIAPPLFWSAAHTLLDSQASSLAVLQKREIGYRKT
jgi:16S rRNA (guanine527-N7)-methyltransferase